MSGDSRDGCSVESERDFYRRLLDLGGKAELEPLLTEALALIVEVTGAAVGYLELYEDDGGEPLYWKGHQCSDADLGAIRTSISRGIIGRAIADGETVETQSARVDPRFGNLGSVRRNAIHAVLCAPVGVPAIGVVYLQGRARSGPFTREDRDRAELFARQLAPLADRLVSRRRDDRVDHTREIRSRFQCAGVVGRSRALADVLHGAALAAPLHVDVLITGPSGTGKSALARVIHGNSPRASGPFVAINCAAIPEALIESELFGAERGAHSTATLRVVGKVAAADGGTLFLDEVAELSAGAQAKLLHLLQAREYHPLGASRAVAADVRIISATNGDLKARVAARQFREDLFYRLQVLPLRMPGLHERRGDIELLVDYFVADTCRRHGLGPLEASAGARFACREAAWPGHVRELAHALEAAAIRAAGERADLILDHHIFVDRRLELAPTDDEGAATFQAATRRFQARYVREALERNDWNVARTGRELGVARSHLYTLLHEYRLKRADG